MTSTPTEPRPTPPTRRIDRAANALLVAGFLVGISVPLSGLFLGGSASEIEQTEHRKAAAYPALTFKQSGWIRRPDSRSIKHFPRRFENWFGDHIGFRRKLIQLYQLSRYYGCVPSGLSQSGAKSGADQSRVIVGRDDWLFYNSKNVVDDIRGKTPFTRRQLDDWNRVLAERRDWLAARGIRYVVVIAPNKHTVYPEHLPGAIGRQAGRTRLDQLTAHLSSESDVTFVNLADALRKAKSRRRVFHKHDTHWNAYGAFVGYRELMRTIQPWFPDVTPRTLDDYRIVRHECEPANVHDVAPWVHLDLATMLDCPIPCREELIDLVPIRDEVESPVSFAGETAYESDAPRRQTREAGGIPRAYVIHDSFMMALAPYLSTNCREVTYRWTKEFPADEIERERPALVIQQMVERRLMDVEPENPSQVTSPPIHRLADEADKRRR